MFRGYRSCALHVSFFGPDLHGLGLQYGRERAHQHGVAEVATKLPVIALPGYEVSVFTQNDSRLIVSNPDAVAVDGQHVFIDYQNVTAKDCSDQGQTGSPTSTVIEYDMKGKILNHWSVAGHSDGMRVYPATHLVWTTSCEDGSPMFATIDPSSGTITPVQVPRPAARRWI